MRITDPRWPAARELSRIILRTDDLLIQGPSWLKEHVQRLSIQLGDVQPSRTSFPTFGLNTTDEIHITASTSERALAVCGLTEPSIDVLWFPMTAKDAWGIIASMTSDLLDAGYPGCLGCGGPQSEQAWNELESRKTMMQSHEKEP